VSELGCACPEGELENLLSDRRVSAWVSPWLSARMKRFEEHHGAIILIVKYNSLPIPLTKTGEGLLFKTVFRTA